MSWDTPLALLGFSWSIAQQPGIAWHHWCLTKTSRLQRNLLICVLPSRESNWDLSDLMLLRQPLGSIYVVSAAILQHYKRNIKLTLLTFKYPPSFVIIVDTIHMRYSPRTPGFKPKHYYFFLSLLLLLLLLLLSLYS